MDVFPKWIVEDLQEDGVCLILGKATYHKQIAHTVKNVKGGGWWRKDEEAKEFYLHGTSEDFGSPSMEDLAKCIQGKRCFTSYALTRNLSEYKFFWLTVSGEKIDLETFAI